MPAAATDEEKAKKAAEDKAWNDRKRTAQVAIEALEGQHQTLWAAKVKAVDSLPGKCEVPNLKRTITAHKKKVYSARWHPDSLHVVTAGQEGNVIVSNASLGLITKMPIKQPFVMQCAIHGSGDFDSGPTLVAAGGMKNAVTLYKCDTGSAKMIQGKSWDSHEGYISALHFIDNGSKLLSGSGDGSVCLYDVTKGSMTSQFWGHEADVSGVGIDPGDANIFGTSSTDKQVRVWDVRQKYAVRKFEAKYANNCCALAPGAKGIVVGCDNASYEFFSVECNKQIVRGKVKKGRCESIALSSSGRTLYAGWDNEMMLIADAYKADSSTIMSAEKGNKDAHTSSVCSLNIAPDGSALLSSSFDCTAKVWGA